MLSRFLLGFMSVISCRLCKLNPIRNPEMTYEAIMLSLALIHSGPNVLIVILLCTVCSTFAAHCNH